VESNYGRRRPIESFSLAQVIQHQYSRVNRMDLPERGIRTFLPAKLLNLQRLPPVALPDLEQPVDKPSGWATGASLGFLPTRRCARQRYVWEVREIDRHNFHRRIVATMGPDRTN